MKGGCPRADCLRHVIAGHVLDRLIDGVGVSLLFFYALCDSLSPEGVQQRKGFPLFRPTQKKKLELIIGIPVSFGFLFCLFLFLLTSFFLRYYCLIVHTSHRYKSHVQVINLSATHCEIKLCVRALCCAVHSVFKPSTVQYRHQKNG